MEKVSLEGPLKQQQNVLAVGETNRQTDRQTYIQEKLSTLSCICEKYLELKLISFFRRRSQRSRVALSER